MSGRVMPHRQALSRPHDFKHFGTPMMQHTLVQAFEQQYAQAPERLFFAPARVNLIGEHIDYNGGLVLPCALDSGTFLAMRPHPEPILHLASLNFPEQTLSVPLQAHGYQPLPQHWGNYPLGVVDYFVRHGHDVGGMSLLFGGNIPNGAGLSSSASIELVTALMLNEVFGGAYGALDLVRIAQEVENRFVGVNCGIMDQFACGMGRADHALLLDCQTLAHRYIPLPLADHALLIINSRKQRTLADSQYNQRCASCDAALAALRPHTAARHLCELSPADFERLQTWLPEAMRPIVRHVVTEQERVQHSAEALAQGDVHRFGALMNASHQSLRDDYQVTGVELDTIHAESLKLPGVLGCRMTGAGFGGCAVALVEQAHVASYADALTHAYQTIIGYPPAIYPVRAGDGMRELSLPKYQTNKQD